MALQRLFDAAGNELSPLFITPAKHKTIAHAVEIAIAKGGGIVYINDAYSLTEQIIVNSDKVCFFLGPKAVITAAVAMADAMIIFGDGSGYTTGYSRIGVYGYGKIDGNGLAQRAIYAYGPHDNFFVKGVEVTGTIGTQAVFAQGASAVNPITNVLMQGINCHDIYEGLQVYDCDRFKIINNDVVDLTSTGQDNIETSGYSSNGLIAGNYLRDAGQTNSFIDIFNSGESIIVARNIIESTADNGGTSGVSVHATAGDFHKVKILQNIIKGPIGTGIVVTQEATRTTDGVEIIGNDIVDLIGGNGNTSRGIHVLGGTVKRIKGNTFGDVDYYQIDLATGLGACDIIGNRFKGVAVNAIYAEGAPVTDQHVIARNRFEGTVVTHYRDFPATTPTLLENNIFAGTTTGGRPVHNQNAAVLTARNNVGFLTENNGTATVGAASTTVNVNHGLARTPAADDISVTPTNNLGSSAKFWVTGVTATQFTINVDVAPGGSGAAFAWTVSIQ